MQRRHNTSEPGLTLWDLPRTLAQRPVPPRDPLSPASVTIGVLQAANHTHSARLVPPLREARRDTVLRLR